MELKDLTMPELLRKAASALRKAAEDQKELEEKVAAFEEQDKLAEMTASLNGTVDDPEGAIRTMRDSGRSLEEIKTAVELMGAGTPEGGIFKVASDYSSGHDSTDAFINLVAE